MVGFEDGGLADGFAASFNHFKPDVNNNIVRITNQADLAAATGNLFKRLGTAPNGAGLSRADEIKLDLMKI
jgi:hypothetical protein